MENEIKSILNETSNIILKIQDLAPQIAQISKEIIKIMNDSSDGASEDSLRKGYKKCYLSAMDDVAGYVEQSKGD